MTVSLPAYLFREHRSLLLMVLLLAAAAVAVWGFLLLPQRQERERLQQLRTEKRQQLHERGRGAGPDLQRTRHRLDSLLATAPGRSEFPRILGQVTDYAALHGATVRTLTYRALPSTIEGLECSALSIGASGSYGAVKPFLAELQNLNALAYVETASLVNPDPRTEQLSLEVRMLIHLRPEVAP